MSSPLLNVLVLCTGNSARSIIAEGVLRKKGGSDFQAYSAGSQPAGQPNPYALVVLRNHDIDIGFARSKRWDIFADPTGLKGDLIITACENAAGETCPVWPGIHPVRIEVLPVRLRYEAVMQILQLPFRQPIEK